MNIVQLMQVPPPQHDLAWLQEALQAAIQLELATLPPYLCAMWSIASGDGDAYDAIHEIVMDDPGKKKRAIHRAAGALVPIFVTIRQHGVFRLPVMQTISGSGI